MNHFLEKFKIELNETGYRLPLLQCEWKDQQVNWFESQALNIHDYLDLYDKIHEFPNCGNLRVQSTVTLDLHGLNGHHDLWDLKW